MSVGFEYPAEIVRVVDADTIRLDIDLGFDTWRRNEPVRVAGINAPENNTDAGKAATVYARTLLPPGTKVRLVSHSLDKYRRALGSITFPAPQQLRDVKGDYGTALISAGHAVRWDGRGERPTA